MHMKTARKIMEMLSADMREITDVKKKGFALLSVTIMLGIIITSVVTLASYSLTTKNIGKLVEAEYDSKQIADAGLQKALYCFREESGTNCGGTFGSNYIGETDVSFGNGRFTISVTQDGEARIMDVTGTNRRGYSSRVRARFSQDAQTYPDTTFEYAVQAGDEGLVMNNNAKIYNGPARSNSDIDCGNNSSFEGDIFVSSAGGTIDNCAVGGDAHADNITDSDVEGDCYYDSNFSGSSCDGAEYPGSDTPSEVPIPSMDLELWRTAAEAGGTITGDYEPDDNTALGPIKITGDLILNNNTDLTITGPIWVMGNIISSNNSSMTLDASFGRNSTIILADNPGDISAGGKIYMTNNTEFSGSGEDGSYIVFVSTNDSLDTGDPAIKIKNNSVGGIFLAMNGLVYFWNNADAAAIAGEGVYMRNNSIINYENIGLTPSDLILSTGQPGGWGMETGTWQSL